MRKRSTPSIPLLLAGAALAALSAGTLLSSCSHSSETPTAATTPAASSDRTQPTLQLSPESSATATTSSHTATIYKIVMDENGSHLEPQVTRLAAGDSDDAPVAALNAMAKLKDSPLPPGSEAQSVVISGDTATVDFNEAFQKNFGGGDEKEALTLNAVMATLAQYPGVHQVQFTVAGKKIGSLGGTQTLNTPLPVPSPLPQPHQTAQSESGSGASSSSH